MKKLYFLLLTIVVFGLYACKKESASQQVMIMGKWSLQKQNVSEYIDGVKQADVTVFASDKATGYAQFNKDGSVISVSIYNSKGIGSTSLGSIIKVDSVRGTYGFTGQAFNLSVIGLANLNTEASFSTGSGPLPVMHLVSKSAQITQLTASALSIHTEYTITESIGSETKTYKNLLDYYYTR